MSDKIVKPSVLTPSMINRQNQITRDFEARIAKNKALLNNFSHVKKYNPDSLIPKVPDVSTGMVGIAQSISRRQGTVGVLNYNIETISKLSNIANESLKNLGAIPISAKRMLDNLSRPSIAMADFLKKQTDMQKALQNQINELAKMPDIPRLFSSKNIQSALKMTPTITRYNNILSEKRYIHQQSLNLKNSLSKQTNLNSTLSAINRAYANETVNTQQKIAFEKAKTVAGNIIYISFNFTASSVLFYSTKAYRKLEETYANNKWKQSTLEASKSLVGDFIDQTISYLLFNNPYSIPFNVIFLIKALGTILYIIMSKDD